MERAGKDLCLECPVGLMVVVMQGKCIYIKVQVIHYYFVPVRDQQHFAVCVCPFLFLCRLLGEAHLRDCRLDSFVQF